MRSIGLLVGPASVALGEGLAHELGATPIRAEVRLFPDGETCVRAPGVGAGEPLVIVQGTNPPQDRHLVQLLQMIELARSQGAGPIVCAVPYLAYARQDRRNRPGEPLSAQLVLQMLASAGADTLITVEVHNPDIFRDAPLTCINLDAHLLLAERLAGLGVADPVLICPDRGGAQRLQRLSRRLGWPVLSYLKHKSASGRTWYEQDDRDLRGRHAVVIDDLCSSGSTFIPLARRLFEAGVSGISYGVVHFFADASRIEREVGRPVDIFHTDSIEHSDRAIPLAGLLADGISALFCDSGVLERAL